MVHRKQAHIKPKDLVVLAEEELPAGQLRRGGDPGGGVRRTALAPLPNYMRATSCFGAKVGRASRREAASAPPPTKVVFARAPTHVGRATCSSAMKGPVAACAPAAAAHVCSYAYCSLKGHVHASVVPLDTFLASRRRLIKTQQSMKLMGASPFRKPNNGGGGEGYFIEIHAGAGDAAPPMGLDVSCSSGISTEEEYVMFDHPSRGDDVEDKAKDSGASLDGSCGSSVVISDGSLESSGSTKNRNREDKEALVVDHEDDYFGACKSDISDELGIEHEGSIPEGEISDNASFSDIAHTDVGIRNRQLIMTKKYGDSADVGGDAPKEYSSDGISSALSGISFEDASSHCADAAMSRRKKLHISGRRTSEEGCKQMRPFKPKAPNFLPVETGPEAEKVDLRRQAVNDRRGAEEWMVDYALRKAVKKLARAQKRKVEMLVQAFETVLPTVASEKEPVQHDADSSTFTLSRPSQACS